MTNLDQEQIQAELAFQQLLNTQYLHKLHPDTLLTIDQAAILLRRTARGVGNDVVRNPSGIPIFCKISGRVVFKKSDIDSFINAIRQRAIDERELKIKPQKKMGRPTKAEQIAKRIKELKSVERENRALDKSSQIAKVQSAGGAE